MLFAVLNAALGLFLFWNAYRLFGLTRLASELGLRKHVIVGVLMIFICAAVGGLNLSFLVVELMR
jgi:hypothetical protein